MVGCGYGGVRSVLDNTTHGNANPIKPASDRVRTVWGKEGGRAWREEAGGRFRETAQKAPERLVTQHNDFFP